MAKKNKSANLKILLDVSRAAGMSLSLDEVSDFILKKVKKVLSADHGAIFLLDEDKKHLFLFDARGFLRGEIENIKILGGWEEITKEVVKKSKPLLVNDIMRDPRFRKRRIAFYKEKIPFNAFIAVPLRTKSEKVIGVLIISRKKGGKNRFTDGDRKLLSVLADHVSVALLNAKLHNEVHELFLSAIKAFITAIDAKDPYTHGHSERVMKYSVAIAKAMGKRKTFMDNLRLSSLLHDIGKIGISQNILSKKGPLDKSEKKIVREHPLIGAKIVGSIKESEKIIPAIMEHHERFDGGGYPYGLKGRQITLVGRIVALADTFDTITTQRTYHRAAAIQKAYREITQCSGTHFDPLVIKAFKKSFKSEQRVWTV